MSYLVVIFTNFGPYHLARLQALETYCQNRQWKLTGIELARSEADYAWQVGLDKVSFQVISVLEGKALESTSIPELGLKLWRLLNNLNPDGLALAGYSHPAMLCALFWGRLQHKSTILMSATNEDDFDRRNWKENVKSLIIKQFQAALVGGQPQKRYLIKLGMPEASIALGYNVVGNDSFHPDLISDLPLPLVSPFFLAINRFISKKNLPFLIRAYSQYLEEASIRWDLVLCGNGELRPQIEDLIKKLGLNDCVHLPGFLQQDQLLPYFAHAKCFIHASLREQWGLVVNEAMAAGLPVLVSNRCGCYEDLVIEGVNGFGFDPENVDELASLMLRISCGRLDLFELGQASLQHIQNFSPDYFAQGMFSAIDYALHNR